MNILVNAWRWSATRHDSRGHSDHPGRSRGGAGGPPCRLRSDNGPEFVAQVVRSWLEGRSGPLYVAPGSPWQNGYAESFHSKVRDEFLDREEFESEPQARALGALEGGV